MILDAYAVIALLRDEPAADKVQRILEGDGQEKRPTLTAVGVAEVLDHLIRIGGLEEETASLDLAQLGLLDTAPLDPSVAASAGRLRTRHYHRKRCAISLADCIAAESGRAAGIAVVTSDPHLLDVCHREQIAVVALPDTTGSIWHPPDGENIS